MKRAAINRFGLALAAAVGAFAVGPQAHAALTLNAQGIADGFTLSQFALLNPGGTGYGPFGVAYAGSNKVIVSNYATNAIYSFNDTDGQTTASALNTVAGHGTDVTGMASLGGVAYGSAGGFGGHFAAYNSDGTINHVLTSVPEFSYLGMAGDPSRNSIIATTSNSLIEIDPLANGGLGSSRVITNASGDGVSVSLDGTTAFVETGGYISKVNIATGSTTALAAYSGLDGTGVISGGAFSGFIVAVSNSGTLGLYNPGTNSYTTIATGGSRGDYAMNDPSTGTLLIDLSEGVDRLSCGAGCSIGGSPPPSTGGVPEPTSWALMIMGFGTVGAMMRRRKALPLTATA